MKVIQALGLVLAAFASSASAAPYTFTTLDIPGAILTEAIGINNAGQVVGFFRDSSGTHGFVASPVPVPLPAAVWLLGTTLGGLGFVRRRLV